MNYKIIQKGQEDIFSTWKIWKYSYYDQTNIEFHYTEAVSKQRFRITQGGIDTGDIHVILPCLVLRRGCMNL